MTQGLTLPAGIDDVSTRALLKVLERWDDMPIEVVLVWLVDHVVADALPFIAEQLGVSGPEFDAGTPRAFLRKAIERRRLRGTVGTLEDVLDTLGYEDHEIKEGGDQQLYDGTLTYDGVHTYGSDTHWAIFIVFVDITGALTQAEGRKLWDAAWKWRPKTRQPRLVIRQGDVETWFRSRDEIVDVPDAGEEEDFDPATLELSGWWRARPAGEVDEGDPINVPFAGVASAGTSGSKSLAHVANDPIAGAAVNGFAPFNCAGKAKQLVGDDMSTFVSPTGYTFVLLFKANSAGAPAANGYIEDAIVADTGGGAFFGCGFSTDGIEVYHFGTDLGTSYDGVVVPASTGAWHRVIARYDGTDLRVRVNGGSEATLAKGNIASDVGGAGNFLRFNDRFIGDQDHGADAAYLEMMFALEAVSDDDADNIDAYLVARYGL